MTESMRNMIKKASMVLIGMIVFQSQICAQAIKAKLEFEIDRIHIGEVVPLRMVIEHPAEIILVFPESRDFAPFELVSREPEPTKTINGVSWDVVTYQVRSFSLDKKQAIRLPYSFYGRRDTVQRYVLTDSIFMNLLTPEDITGLEYKSHNSIISLVDPPNYLIIGMGLAGIFAIFGHSLFLPPQTPSEVSGCQENRS